MFFCASGWATDEIKPATGTRGSYNLRSCTLLSPRSSESPSCTGSSVTSSATSGSKEGVGMFSLCPPSCYGFSSFGSCEETSALCRVFQSTEISASCALMQLSCVILGQGLRLVGVKGRTLSAALSAQVNLQSYECQYVLESSGQHMPFCVRVFIAGRRGHRWMQGTACLSIQHGCLLQYLTYSKRKLWQLPHKLGREFSVPACNFTTGDADRAQLHEIDTNRCTHHHYDHSIL